MSADRFSLALAQCETHARRMLRAKERLASDGFPGFRSNAELQRGFTLVELIMVIVIIGVLALAVAPRLADNDVFQSRGFADQVQASLRYAQKAAIAQRRNVCVAFTASTMAASAASASGAGSACDTDLMSPTGKSGVWITAPSNITFSTTPAGFKFDSLGRPWIGTSSIGTSGVIGTTTLTVEAETGYVH